MKSGIILPAGNTPALTYAVHLLKKSGFPLQDHTGMDIAYLLLDVPSFYDNGHLRSGRDLDALLASLPNSVTICGGNLDHPKLDGYHKIDFLKDPVYVSKNAAITAECAIRVALQHLSATLEDTPALVIGWGRIGKCLARLLRQMGCDVTVACRQNKDRAILEALGYPSMNIASIQSKCPHFRLIYNTAPTVVLDATNLSNCICIDLASQKGMIGDQVIWAKGLPGRYAPETSGKLIAHTFMRLIQEVDT